MRYFDHKGDVVRVSRVPEISVWSLIVLGTVIFGMWGCPKWDVYQQALGGQASLARAESSRKIAVHEALAIKESAQYKADAEVIRAGGVAEAQAIINKTLTPRYIQWLMAESMSEQACDVRYIPTESNLPILEARR